MSDKASARETGGGHSGSGSLSIRSAVGFAFIFSGIINLLLLTSPLFMMQVIDRVLPSANYYTLVYLTGIAIAALLTMSIIEAARGIMQNRTAHWLERTLSTRVLKKVGMPGSKSSGLMGDVSILTRFLSSPSALSIIDAPWTPLFLILVFLLHPWFGLLTLMAGAMLLVITIVGEAVNRKSQEKAEKSQLEATGIAASLHRHFQLTATMGLGDNLRKVHQEKQIAHHALQDLSSERETWLKVLAKFVRHTTQVSTLGLGAVLVLSGDITGGTMIAASIMVARALAPIDQIIGSWRALLEARSARTRVLAALADNDDQGDEAVELPVPGGEISVEGLMLAGSGGQPPRLAQINVRIPAGKCVGVMGPSGSGKSTLADMLAGATAATIGSVRLDGCDLRHWPSDQRARLIGYLPQVPTLFPGTIAANIARYDKDAKDKDIIEAAQLAGVHHLISRMPEGYMSQITSDEGLSGGERQRIALARAIYGRPKVLILDEPNAALDQEGEGALVETIDRLKLAGTTIIMIAHRAGILSVADMLMIIDEGRVRDFGSKCAVIMRMNNGIQQLQISRHPVEISKISEWVEQNFCENDDPDLRARSAMSAVEMFNTAILQDKSQNISGGIMFQMVRSAKGVQISLIDEGVPIAQKRVDKAKRALDVAPAHIDEVVSDDLGLAMLLKLSDSFQQEQMENGRRICVNLNKANDNAKEQSTSPGRVGVSS